MSKKVKVLYVNGDDDFGALSFESSLIDGKTGLDAWNKAMASGGSYSDEWDGNTFNVEALEFDSIDPRFISFLEKNILDYDACKDTNFYVLPDSEAPDAKA